MAKTDNNDNHERFTRLLLESEPVMLRSILVVVPNRADAREIMQETAVALWRQFASYDPGRPFVNWAMGVLERELEGDTSFAGAIVHHLTTCMQKLTEKQLGLIQGYYHESRSVEWLSEKKGWTFVGVI
jgi:hypothetical protein